MPIEDEHRDDMVSNVADLRNSAGRLEVLVKQLLILRNLLIRIGMGFI
jgi:hypothetical protein